MEVSEFVASAILEIHKGLQKAQNTLSAEGVGVNHPYEFKNGVPIKTYSGKGDAVTLIAFEIAVSTGVEHTAVVAGEAKTEAGIGWMFNLNVTGELDYDYKNTHGKTSYLKFTMPVDFPHVSGITGRHQK